MREPYWWEKKDIEEPEEPEGTHFLDSLVEEIKIKPEEEPYFLDEVVKGIAKPELEPDILDETIRTIETEETEKKSYFWLDAWEKAQESYRWMYPGGYGKALVDNWKPVLETTSYAIGDAATFLARLCPNQEDLPAYRDQALPRQALTLAQGTSVVALGILIGATGISALSGLVKFLAYGRADKIAAKFATQHFDKIKALNPQVKNPEDAIALTQASLRSVVAPKAATTYLPTTMQELTKLGKTLLTPLGKNAPTAQFKIAMGDQVRNMVTQAGVEPTAKMLEPFTQTLNHFVGSPVSGIVSKEYGVAIVDAINKHFPPMIEEVIDTGKASLPFDKPIIPEGKMVEDVEEIVDLAMRDKPLTEEQIFAEAREAYLLLDKFTKGDEADKASQLLPEEYPPVIKPEVAPKAEALTVYHGTTKEFAEIDFGERYGQGIFGKEPSKAKVIFFSEDIKQAQYFQSLRGERGRIIEASINPDSNILDVTALKMGGHDLITAIEEIAKVDKVIADEIDEGLEIQQALEDPAFGEKLKRAGYDGIRFIEPEGRGITLGIFNKEVIQTKQQPPIADIPEVAPKAVIAPLSHLTEKDFIKPRGTSGEGVVIQRELLKLKDKTGQELYDYAKDDTVKMEEMIRAVKDDLRIGELENKAYAIADKLPGTQATQEYMDVLKKEHLEILRTEVKEFLFPEVAPTPAELFPEEEIAPTKQMAMYQQELKKLQEAGITGKEAETAALETAGSKYKPKEIRPPAEQLKWELGKPTIKGQRELELKPQPGTPGYIEWWKTLPQDKQDAELLRKQTPEIERLITGELEEMRTEVEEGIPGRRVRTETGEWMGQPSTYPDFMGEFGLTKKQISKAYETKKGKTWGLLQDIARDRVAMGYEHPKLGMVEPMVTKAESDYLIQMREISEEIPEKIIVNEHLGIAEAKLENTPGQPITEKDYAKLAGKYDGQTKALDLTQFDKDTLWMQQVDEQLNSPATTEERGSLIELMTKRGITPGDQKYLLQSMTRDKTKSIDTLTREEATLITNYLEILPTWDPDAPISTIAPAELGKGDPGLWTASLFDYAQNVEAWSERMEAKYPDTKLFSNIVSPVIQARRTVHRKKADLLKRGLEAIKGLTRDEMREIQLWCEEETAGIEHTVTLSEGQEETRAKLLKGINEVADLCELAEEERVPGLGYMPRRYRTEFLERLGIRKRKYDFSALPFDWLSHPKTFKPFFKYERSLEDAPEGAKLDLYASYSQYIRQGLRAHFRDVLESTGPDVKNLPPKLRNYTERWANLASGMPGFGEQIYLNTMGKIKINKNAALFLERTTMDFVYMGGLGLKISFAGKNATQFLHGLSEIPEPWLLHGLGKMFTKEGKELWQKSGCQMYYAPFMARSVPKAKGAYQKIKNTLMILVQKSDQLNREPVYIADHDRTLHYGKLYQEGSIDWTELIRKIDIKRYEKPFQDIVLRHIEKGESEVAADLMGDRVQAYTNWRYWAMVSPMLLQEGGPMSAQFAVWGFNNVDLMWRRRLERGTKLIREGEVKAGVYQYGKVIRHLIYMGLIGKAIEEGTKRVIGKEYEIGPREMIQFLVAGSIPTSLAPIPGMAMAAGPYLIHKLSGRDWLAAEQAAKIKRSARVFIPGNLSFRDWWKALEKETPGEAGMQLLYPQFRAEPEEKKRGWYEPAKREKKEGKRGWYESPGREEEGEKKGWWE